MNKKNNEKSLILVVDDSPEVISMMNETISKADMTPLVALEGEQAISIALKMMPNLILLDAIMPVMDGFETCKKMKSLPELKDIPVIFMTGLTDTESIVKGFEVGGTDYLTKPINPDELIARISVHMVNAKTTKSTKSALDISGQNIFSVNQTGKVLWATPQVEKILNGMNSDYVTHLEKSIGQWLKHTPEEGNRLHFSIEDNELIAIYIGESETNELLIKLIDENSANEKNILMSHFKITSREADVYLWLARGKANREIADILEMSPRTVGKHIEQLFRKLEVDNRTAAAMLAVECLLKTH